MACSNKSIYRKPLKLLYTAFIAGLVISVCIYLELGWYQIYIIPDINRTNIAFRATPLEFQGQRDTSGCFQSLFVVCKNYSFLDKVSPSSGNATRPLVLTTLVTGTHSYRYSEFKTFNMSRHCPLPCVFKPPSKLNEVTGVIVDGDHAYDSHFPVTRHKNQIYLLTVMEPPPHIRENLLQPYSKFKDQINLVSTYRVDSDIRTFYARLCLNDRPKKTRKDFKKIYDKKTRSAAWFVSHCKTQSKRMSYVKELQKYIDVDIYGKCGNKSYPKFGSELRYLSDTYKFYLSFENSFCKDYVTEKFFKLFQDDVYVVSVVRGGMDYDKYFPPKTFINAADFKSPLELAGFLKEVGDDFEKYIVYMEERDKYTREPYLNGYKARMCEACTAFHNLKNAATSRYENIGSWLTKGVCHEPEMSWMNHLQTH